MTELEHKIDRKGWPPGPWDGEPEDRAEWRHRGLPCLAVRSKLGQWCGYAGVPAGHPYYGIDRENVPVEVHGGLTYADKCAGPICHVPRPGETDDVWWLGFDCGHFMDIQPGLSLPSEISEDWMTYKDLGYVAHEVEILAGQLMVLARTAG